MMRNATKMPEQAYPVMIKFSLSGMFRSADGPLKKVAHPSNIADMIKVKRLATHFGNHCTIIIEGM